MVDFLKNKKFIILNDNKTPQHKLDVWYSSTDELVETSPNVGVMIESNYVVIDVDDEAESEFMYEYILKMGYNVNVMNTTRGKHFWFKSEKPLINLIHMQNALSVSCDVRSFGKKCFVVVKKDGIWREWVKLVENDNLCFIPKEIEPNKSGKLKECPSLINLKEGEGRRDALFKRVVPLRQHLNFSKNEIFKLYCDINDLIFEEPLPISEIKNIFNGHDDFFDKIENPLFKYYDQKTNKFLHEVFGDHLHKALHGYVFNNTYHVYDEDEGCYVPVYSHKDRLIGNKMVSILRNIRKNQREETFLYMNSLPNNNEVKCDPFVLNCANGLLNIENEYFEPWTYRYFNLTKINAAYNREADEKVVYDFLKTITLNDNQLISVIEEMIGMILLKDTRFQKAIILFGGGSNGKSTFLDALRALLGESNCSAVSWKQLVSDNRFISSRLVGKMLCTSAETPHKLDNQHTDLIKLLITGDPIEAERKRENAFVFKNYAKFIFATNELPYVSDRTYGFYRRFLVIPFKAKFEAGQADIGMKEKLITPKALSTWLNLGLKGLKRLLNNKGQFTESVAVNKAIDAFKKANNNTIVYFENIKQNNVNIIDWNFDNLYLQYKDYVERMSLGQVFKKNIFHGEFLRYFPEYDLVRTKINDLYILMIKKKGA